MTVSPELVAAIQEDRLREIRRHAVSRVERCCAATANVLVRLARALRARPASC